MTNWEARYLAPDGNFWQGREDTPPGTCFFHHIKLINLPDHKFEKATKPTYAIVGFRCDEGAQRDLGRTGAVEGPIAIRQRLAKLPLRLKNVEIYDVGSIICADHDLRASQTALGEIVNMLLENNIRPIVIGGGHEVAYGTYQGIAKHYDPKLRLGLISLDAHFNLAPLDTANRSSTSTTFYQIAKDCETENRHLDYNCIGIQHASNTQVSFEVARNLDTQILLADDLHQNHTETNFDFVDRATDVNDLIYVSLSMDVFSPAHAPGVSTIQPLGLNPWDIIPLLRQMAASGKAVAYDISEHVPRYDIDHRTAKLAATMIYEIIHHHHNDHVKP